MTFVETVSEIINKSGCALTPQEIRDQIKISYLTSRSGVSSRKATSEISQPHCGWFRFKNGNVLKGRRNGSIFQPLRSWLISIVPSERKNYFPMQNWLKIESSK